MNFIKYEESRPARMRTMIKEYPVAYVPLGALEWHGEHSPLGVDGIKARALCEAAAARTGGVVFPAMFWGAFDTMPFPFTFHFKAAGLRRQVRETLVQLEGFGFKVIVMLTGHYPPTQVKMLKKECRRFNKRGEAKALGVPEQAFATDMDYYGDHAGMWETSLMMAVRPELIDLAAMPAGLSVIERLKKYGVMGKDPVAKADAGLGEKAVLHIVENLARAVNTVLEEGDDRAFEDVYRKHEQALSIFSTRIIHVIREALDVHSLGDLIRYGVWSIRNQ